MDLAPPRVLGVDDNPRNLTILRKALGDSVQFLTAASGEEALSVAELQQPDVVLLDIMMPGIDGYETCRRLREQPAGREMKIILVSAKAMTSERLAGYDAGADDYVTKPFDPDELLAKVRVYSRLRSVEHLERAKTDLLHILGHETRTPLSTILMPLPMLREAPGLTAEHHDLLDMIERGARRLLTLIERCSFLSQLQVGRVPCQLVVSDVMSQVRLALGRIAPRVSEAGVTVALEGPSEVRAPLDPVEFAMVLDVVLDNAVRFSPAGGTVRVMVRAEADRALVAIRDEGPGVAPEYRRRLFESFFSGDVQHHDQGLGVGLATARALMKLHSGDLSLAPTSDPGAEFHISLPVAEERNVAA